MARRRRKPSDFDLAKLIVGTIFLLSFAYAGNLKEGLQLSLIVLAVGGALIGVGAFVQKTRREPTVKASNSSHRSREKQYTDYSPLGNLDQKFDQESPHHVEEKTEIPADWSLELIQSLDWRRFEALCAGYFDAKGRKTEVTDLGADGGIDVLLYGENDPEKVLGIVQCKAWHQKPVGVKEIRELLGLMTDSRSPLGIYITTSSYTPDAKAFAEGKHIKLLDAGQLLKLIRQLPLEVQYSLLQKITAGDYTTPSCPNCGIKLVLRTSRKGSDAGRNFWGCPNFPRCRYTMRLRKSA